MFPTRPDGTTEQWLDDQFINDHPYAMLTRRGKLYDVHRHWGEDLADPRNEYDAIFFVCDGISFIAEDDGCIGVAEWSKVEKAWFVWFWVDKHGELEYLNQHLREIL